MAKLIRVRFNLATAFLVGVAVCGCNPDDGFELGNVTGTVTLDGKIVQGADLEFSPVSGNGSLAYGSTDENGEYKMRFTLSRDGAMVGANKVRITSGEPVTWDSKTYNDRPNNMRELFPGRYNRKTELECTVEKGKNVCNFECTTAK